MNIKNKGKRGEKEFTELLAHHLGRIKGKSDISLVHSAHDQGADIYAIDGLAIEVKRHETLNLNSWWRQAEIQADNLGAIPIVVYRQNRKAWQVLLPASLLVIGMKGHIGLSIEQFWVWLAHYLGK